MSREELFVVTQDIGDVFVLMNEQEMLKSYVSSNRPIENSPEAAKIETREGIELLRKWKYEEALLKFESALKYYKRYESEQEAATVRNYKGICLQGMEKYEEALQLHDLNSKKANDRNSKILEKYKTLHKCSHAVCLRRLGRIA